MKPFGAWLRTGSIPLSSKTRRAILESFEESYSQRSKKKRRINLRFIQEDVRKTLRKTHPNLPAQAVRNVFNAILRTGLLRHKDGLPIRSTSAPFNLDQNIDEIGKAMVSTYLGSLVENDAEIDNTEMLSELFFGDIDQVDYISGTLEWMSEADDAELTSDPDDLDLDDLLVVDGTDEAELDTSTENAETPARAPSESGYGPVLKSQRPQLSKMLLSKSNLVNRSNRIGILCQCGGFSDQRFEFFCAQGSLNQR